MKIDIFTVGDFGANCYIVSTENAAVMIDCGDSTPLLDKTVEQLGEKLKAILLTHGHSDHISATEYYRALSGARVFISGGDLQALTDPYFSVNGMLLESYPFTECSTDVVTVNDNDILNFGDINVGVISTPGHSRGSVCYKIGENLFSGDTLFNLSIGRTDFPDSSGYDMLRSLERLMELGNSVTVYPGHGEKTLIGYERLQNPYIRGASNL